VKGHCASQAQVKQSPRATSDGALLPGTQQIDNRLQVHCAARDCQTMLHTLNAIREAYPVGANHAGSRLFR